MEYIVYPILVLCIILSAFFSATEIAVVSIGRIHLRRIIKEGKAGADFLQKLKKNQRKTIVTILIGNNIVNVTASTIAAGIAIERYGELGVGIATGVMTFVLLMLGEILPKSFAGANAEKFALFASPIMYSIMKILSPLVHFFDFFAKIVGKTETRVLSEKDIHAMVELGVEENVIEPHEQKLIERVLRFNDVPVKEIMVPFKKFVALDANSTLMDASKTIVRYGFSRFPVYSDKKNNVVGIVRAKDLVDALSNGENGKILYEIILPTIRVRETELIDDVFRLFQKAHNHMGFVVDSNGEVVGLVTMEDMIEEIMGEFESDGVREAEGHA
ncbi:MAG: hemolysin family protein [Candidatus Micrarchaeota archaeon]